MSSWCKNYEDALKYSYKSRQYIDWICPHCGTEIPHKSISNIVKDGLSCPNCSDKISYPQKLMMHILCHIRDNYLPWMEILTEYSPSWCKYKGLTKNYHKGRYDFAIKKEEKILMIIEMDGLYHYVDNKMSGQSFFNSDWIDLEKNILAKKNLGIYPIRIDCKKSELDYIKNNILDSQLNTIFWFWGVNLEKDVDWSNCEKRALKSVVKNVCDLYNDGLHAYQIIEKTGLSRSAVYSYLKKGARVKLCNYPDGREKKRKQEATSNYCSKSIICFNDMKEFKNAKEAANYYPNIKTYNQINAWASRNKVCTILHPNGFPYDFMYKEDYEKNGYYFKVISNLAYHYTSIPVICTTTKKIFDNINDAANYYHVDKQQIYKCCEKKCNSAGSIDQERLYWEYYNIFAE